MRNRSSAFLLVSFVPLAGCGFLKKADADAGIVGLRCPPGQDAVMVSANVAPSCRKVCASDKDCKHSCQAATNNMGKSIKACMSD